MQNEPERDARAEELQLDPEEVADLDVPNDDGDDARGGKGPTTEDPFSAVC